MVCNNSTFYAYACWPDALSTHGFPIIPNPPLPYSLKASPPLQFLSISSPTGLWNFLSSNWWVLPPFCHSPSFFWSSFPLKCLMYYHPGTSSSSQGTQTSSCSTFNSSWSQGCLPLILSQTSAPAGQIHTDSISHYGCVLSALQIF